MSDIIKQDLIDMEKRVSEAAHESEARIVGALKAHVTESTYNVETKLSRAFHGWARSMEVRVRTGTQLTFGMDERLALAEERISELERRKDSAA